MNILDVNPDELVFPKLETNEDNAGHYSAKPNVEGKNNFFFPPMVCKWGVGELNPAKKINKHTVSMGRNDMHPSVNLEHVQKTFEILDGCDEALARHILSSKDTKLEYLNDAESTERDVRKAMNRTLKWPKSDEAREKYGPNIRPQVPFRREKVDNEWKMTTDLRCTVVGMDGNPIMDEDIGRKLTAKDLMGRGYVGMHTVQLASAYNNNNKSVGLTWHVLAIRVICFISLEAPVPPADMFGVIPGTADALIAATDAAEAAYNERKDQEDNEEPPLPPTDIAETKKRERDEEEVEPEEEVEEEPVKKKAATKKKNGKK